MTSATATDSKIREPVIASRASKYRERERSIRPIGIPTCTLLFFRIKAITTVAPISAASLRTLANLNVLPEDATRGKVDTIIARTNITNI